MLRAEDVHIAHFLPGRVRLKVPALRGRPQAAETLAAAFRAVPGVKRLDVNTLTGSVLITYDAPTLATREASGVLKGVLQQHLPGLDAEQVLRWLGVP